MACELRNRSSSPKPDRCNRLRLQSRDAVIDHAQVLIDELDRLANVESLTDPRLQLIAQSLPMLTHLIERLAIFQAHKGIHD
jgi:hypothetical protein